MNFLGYIKPFMGFSFSIPLYTNGENCFFHSMNENYKVTNFEKCDPEKDQVILYKSHFEVKVGDFGLIVFIGSNSFPIIDFSNKICYKVNSAYLLSEISNFNLIKELQKINEIILNAEISNSHRTSDVKISPDDLTIIQNSEYFLSNLNKKENLKSNKYKYPYDFLEYILEEHNLDLYNIHQDACRYNLDSWKLNMHKNSYSKYIKNVNLLYRNTNHRDKKKFVSTLSQMAVTSYGIGSIILRDAGIGFKLEYEDFNVILARWCKFDGFSDSEVIKTLKKENLLENKNNIPLAKFTCERSGLLSENEMQEKLNQEIIFRITGGIENYFSFFSTFMLLPILGNIASVFTENKSHNIFLNEAKSWYFFKASFIRK